MSQQQPPSRSSHNTRAYSSSASNIAQRGSPSLPGLDEAKAPSHPNMNSNYAVASHYNVSQDGIHTDAVTMDGSTPGLNKTQPFNNGSTTHLYSPAYPTYTNDPSRADVNTAHTHSFDPAHPTHPSNSPHITQTSTQPPFPAPSPLSTTNTPTHILTSSSLSLLTSTTTSYNPFEHFLSTTPTNDPWNNVAYHARPRRD